MKVRCTECDTVYNDDVRVMQCSGFFAKCNICHMWMCPTSVEQE